MLFLNSVMIAKGKQKILKGAQQTNERNTDNDELSVEIEAAQRTTKQSND